MNPSAAPAFKQSALSAFSKPEKLDIKLLTPSTKVNKLEEEEIAHAALEALEDHSNKHDQATSESKKRSFDEGSDEEVASILSKKPKFGMGRGDLHFSDSPSPLPLLVSPSSELVNKE